MGLMGNERDSKQNGVEALYSDCNTLEEIETIINLLLLLLLLLLLTIVIVI